MRKPYRLDVSSKKVGLLMFVNEAIPSKHLQSFKLTPGIQAMPVEVNLKRRRLLILSIYKPADQNLFFLIL